MFSDSVFYFSYRIDMRISIEVMIKNMKVWILLLWRNKEIYTIEEGRNNSSCTCRYNLEVTIFFTWSEYYTRIERVYLPVLIDCYLCLRISSHYIDSSWYTRIGETRTYSFIRACGWYDQEIITSLWWDRRSDHSSICREYDIIGKYRCIRRISYRYPHRASGSSRLKYRYHICTCEWKSAWFWESCRSSEIFERDAISLSYSSPKIPERRSQHRSWIKKWYTLTFSYTK